MRGLHVLFSGFLRCRRRTFHWELCDAGRGRKCKRLVPSVFIETDRFYWTLAGLLTRSFSRVVKARTELRIRIEAAESFRERLSEPRYHGGRWGPI